LGRQKGSGKERTTKKTMRKAVMEGKASGLAWEEKGRVVWMDCRGAAAVPRSHRSRRQKALARGQQEREKMTTKKVVMESKASGFVWEHKERWEMDMTAAAVPLLRMCQGGTIVLEDKKKKEDDEEGEHGWLEKMKAAVMGSSRRAAAVPAFRTERMEGCVREERKEGGQKNSDPSH
jgi:hypothetical protein